MLIQDYFTNLIPRKKNKYEKHNVHDFTLSEKTNRSISLKQELDLDDVTNKEPLNEKLTSYFNISDITLKKYTKHDSFDILIIIVNDSNLFSGLEINKNQIKQKLIDAYKSYTNEYLKEILKLLVFDGKQDIVEKISRQELDLDTIIMDDAYYLTPTDILLFSFEYKIPILIIMEHDTTIKVSSIMKSNEYYCLFYDKSNHDLSLFETSFTLLIYKTIMNEKLLTLLEKNKDNFTDYIQSVSTIGML